MINQKDIEKLKCYSEGSLSEAEVNSIYSLFSENEKNREFEKQIRMEFYEYIKNNPEADFNLSNLLNRIHHVIHKRESKAKQTIVQKIYKWYSFAAAVLVIPLLITGSIWFIEQKTENSVTTENPVITTLFKPKTN